MEEALSDFPFRKLSFDKYLILEALMYIEQQDVYNFMFSVNKETRAFIQTNFIAIRNGFVNEGLITYELKHDFISYHQLENLYF